MGELWNLPEPHTPLEVGLSDGAYSHRLCPPHALSLRTSPFSYFSKGGMGACPHVYPRPLTFCARMPRRKNPPALPASPAILLPVIACSHRACASGKAAFSHCPFPWGMGCNPMIKSGPCPSVQKYRNGTTC